MCTLSFLLHPPFFLILFFMWRVCEGLVLSRGHGMSLLFLYCRMSADLLKTSMMNATSQQVAKRTGIGRKASGRATRSALVQRGRRWSCTRERQTHGLWRRGIPHPSFCLQDEPWDDLAQRYRQDTDDRLSRPAVCPAVLKSRKRWS